MTDQPQAQQTVTDAMVEAGITALHRHWGGFASDESVTAVREIYRAMKASSTTTVDEGDLVDFVATALVEVGIYPRPNQVGHTRGAYRRWAKAAIEALSVRPSPSSGLTELLVKAVRSFRNADTEYGRARNTCEQPRLSNAGSRYAIAKFRMFKALDALLARLTEGRNHD